MFNWNNIVCLLLNNYWMTKLLGHKISWPVRARHRYSQLNMIVMPLMDHADIIHTLMGLWASILQNAQEIHNHQALKPISRQTA